MAEEDKDLRAHVDAVRASGKYQLLSLLERPASYETDAGEPKRSALFVDIETTGLNVASDAIIELALVRFDYSPESGKIFTVHDALSYLEDPGRPIPSEIQLLTGITDAMVAGRRIDEAEVARALDQVGLVIAHNSAFDRPILERRLPAFAEKPWACSLDSVPWHRYGIRSRSLEFLLYRHGRAFSSGHRSAQDCYGGIHLLATPFPDGTRPLHLLLDTARQHTARVWAIDSPIELKDRLKARGYRWSRGDRGRPRSWYRDVPEGELGAEAKWLTAEIYSGDIHAVQVQRLDATTRYSSRQTSVPMTKLVGSGTGG